MNSSKPLFHVVLFQPEIPENTGAIGRTCVGVGAKLWLVRPLGFQIDHRRLKRAGLDYWPNLNWETVDDWDHLLDALSGESTSNEEIAANPNEAPFLSAASSAPENATDKATDKAIPEAGTWNRPLPGRFWLMTKRGAADYADAPLYRGDVFVFGAESTGLPTELLTAHADRRLKIPIQPGIRSLNLSVSVGITLFEARRQVYARLSGGK